MTSSASRDRPILALGIRILAMSALATMSALVKVASEHGIHLAEIIFWRQGLTIPIILGWCFATGTVGSLRTDRPVTHFKRGVYGLMGMVLNFSGFILLPLAEATTFGFTAPLYAVLLAAFVLHEKIGPYRWTAVVLGFVGVLIILQPGGSHIPLLGAAAAMTGAFMVAFVSLQLAELNRTDNPITIVFWFAASTTPLAALFMPFVMTYHTATEWALLLAIGLLGGLGQLLLTTSLRFGSVASVIVMDYSSLIWATLYGWLIWERLPTGSTWLGAPLIVAAGIIIAWREHRLARPVKTSAI